MFKRIVNAIEVAALVATLVFVVLLVAYRPSKPKVSVPTPGVAISGAAVFATNCATCHGAHGEGNIGPKLSGGDVVAHFPTVENEIGVVTNGEGSMPAWGGRLTPAEIQAVVEYTRGL